MAGYRGFVLSRICGRICSSGTLEHTVLRSFRVNEARLGPDLFKINIRPLSSIWPSFNLPVGGESRYFINRRASRVLLACLPAGSKLWVLLRDAIEAQSSSALFDVNYEITCDYRDAYALLDSAKKLSGAVEAIEAGIKQLRQKGSWCI
jgi:hypothetical protein